MSKIIAIYDGDALAFRASAVVDNRSVLVQHLPSGRTKEFENRTEFKDLLKSKDMVFNPDDYKIDDQQNPEPLINVYKILKNQINSINSAVFADDYLICLSGKNNFRDTLPLPSKYKSNREGLMRPVHLKAAKTFLWRNHPSLLADNREADDDLIIKGYEYLNKGYIPILVSQDKDAYSASGLNLYDFTADDPILELVPDFGLLWDTGKKITGRGFIWLMFQMVNGDIADHWKPSEIAGKKYREKSAYKLLKDCKTEYEALTKVVNQYKEWYPKPFDYVDWTGKKSRADYKDMFQLYFKCARMMQHETDDLNAAEFCRTYGVEL